MEYNNKPEYRLPNKTKVKSLEDGRIYTVRSSRETNNQFGYGVYFYQFEEGASGFGLYWKWFEVISESQVINLLLKERDHFKEAVEWYADTKTYQLGVEITMGSAFPKHEPIKYDKGERARKSLLFEEEVN